MPDTLPNIDIPADVWVDLYDATGITVGTRIIVENVGVADVYMTTLATEPPIDHDAHVVIRRDESPVANASGASGAWAFCKAGSKVNVVEFDDAVGASPEDYFTEVSKGNIVGDTNLLFGGFNDTLVAGVTQDVWCGGGIMTWLTTPEIIEVESLDAADTDGGTGAHSLLLIGRGADGESLSEFIILNGGIKDSVNTYLSVTASFLVAAGSTESNVGVINFTGKVSGDLQNCIPPERGITDSSHYLVPTDRAAIATCFKFSAVRTTGGQQPIVNFRVHAKFAAPDSAWIIIAEVDLNTAVQLDVTLEADTAPILEGGAKIRVQATSSENGTVVRARTTGILYTP